MRKFKTSKVGLPFSNQAAKAFYDLVNDNARTKKYTFRNLINIYYDFSLIGVNVDIILNCFMEEFKDNEEALTIPVMLQILQAASQKIQYGLTFKEYVMIAQLLIKIDEGYKQLKIDQKCLLFKYVARLELRYHPMKYEFPSFFMKLKNDIKANLNLVNENLLMSIINAYAFLPKNFPNDLLNEIKDVFVVTLQENGKNVNSEFLIEFFENFQQIIASKKKRNFRPENFRKFSFFIGERIKSKDPVMTSTKSLNKLITIFETEETTLANLINPIYDACLLNMKNKTNILSATTLEIFYKFKKDITPFLEQVIFLI